MARPFIVEQNPQALECYQIRACLVAPGSLNCAAEPVHLNHKLAHPDNLGYKAPDGHIVLGPGPVLSP